jgi:hypothetical protein
MSKLLECFVCLISRLRDTPENLTACQEASRVYKPILLSSDDEKKTEISERIGSSITPVFEQYRKDIMNRNFSFLGENVLIIDQIDVGSLYQNTLMSDNDTNIKKVTSELLFLFHSIMSEEDKALVESKFKKPKKAKKAKSETALDMDKMLSKNKDDLKKLENDANPDAIGDVMGNILKNNSGDLGKMATNILGTMGLDPSKLSGKGKRKTFKQR